MNMLVFTMVFHTYVAYEVYKSKNRGEDGWGKGFSLMRQARFMTPSSRQQALDKVVTAHIRICVDSVVRVDGSV